MKHHTSHHMQTHTHSHTTHTHTCTHTHTHTHMHTYTHTHTHKTKNKNTHTHTHKHTHRNIEQTYVDSGSSTAMIITIQCRCVRSEITVVNVIVSPWWLLTSCNLINVQNGRVPMLRMILCVCVCVCVCV